MIIRNLMCSYEVEISDRCNFDSICRALTHHCNGRLVNRFACIQHYGRLISDRHSLCHHIHIFIEFPHGVSWDEGKSFLSDRLKIYGFSKQLRSVMCVRSTYTAFSSWFNYYLSQGYSDLDTTNICVKYC